MIKTFADREYSRMLFDPTKIPEGGDVLKFYKELQQYKEFKVNPGEGIDQNKLLCYIFLAYDLHSPYRQKYSDVIKRKIEVAHDTGFEVNEEGRFASPVEDFLKGKNEKVNKKIVTFVRMHRSFKYAYLVTLEANYYSMMAEVLGGEQKKVSLLKEAQEELEETLTDIFSGDRNVNLREELLRYMEEDRLGLRPEDIAQKTRDGKKPV